MVQSARLVRFASEMQAPATARMHFSIIDDLDSVSATQWNALAGGQPFVQHAFLHGLQATGCVGAARGWLGMHVLMWQAQRLVGAMPLYLKTHSQGEYVFDHVWAHAFERHGLPYYPKLLAAVPFSPVPGPRLLAHTHEHRVLLARCAMQLARQHGCSSLHVLFPSDTDRLALQEAGLLMREDVQFHWHNQGWTSFEDFLASLNQKTRKKLRQDSRKVEQAGVRLRWLAGAEITDPVLAFFHRCYVNTHWVRGRDPYLNLAFFQRLHRTLPQALLIVQAEQAGKPIASALSLRDTHALYGRYWGSTAFVPGLHFETCYVQAIRYCLAHGLSRFEGGAQGEHKLSRGMLPVRTHSAHWIAHPFCARAIESFLRQESLTIGRYMDELEAHSPFRQSGQG